MSGGDPALVEGTSLCAAGDGRAVGADDGNLVGGVDLLGLAGGALSALAALAAALLLGEESGDPGVVDEVDDAAEGGEEEEVEEDAGRGGCVSLRIFSRLEMVILLTSEGRTSSREPRRR